MNFAAGGDMFHHVRDSFVFELPFHVNVPIDPSHHFTKFMLLQLIIVLVGFFIFRGLGQRVATGKPVEGRWWNFWEMLCVFLRDEVVRPTIGTGHHDHGDDHGQGHDDHHHEEEHDGPGHPADKYLPLILSCFFYVLFCNLIGAFPV